ncbi:hypothetical protein PVAG01_00122 [Phlyctema vagabunda]|uniref:Uncharacterized protein n=1 Tax=Phlyctema vagabunda TaxID=108571 RepID=A0ABR4PTC8_9HELO
MNRRSSRVVRSGGHFNIEASQLEIIARLRYSRAPMRHQFSEARRLGALPDPFPAYEIWKHHLRELEEEESRIRFSKSFRCLPPEIRCMIFELCVEFPDELGEWELRVTVPPLLEALRSDPQLYLEAAPLYHERSSTLSFRLDRMGHSRRPSNLMVLLKNPRLFDPVYDPSRNSVNPMKSSTSYERQLLTRGPK